MRYLIVNADDFGASPGASRGIVEAHQRGIVTSASLMVDMDAAADAARRAMGETSLSLGLHLLLPALGSEGGLDYDDTVAVRDSVMWQVERFLGLAGKLPTHLDTHHNVHRDARLRPTLLGIAGELAVPLREASAARYIPDFYGQWGGETHPEAVSVASLLELLDRPDPAVLSELGCHPGYVDADHVTSYSLERRFELRTLCHPALRTALSGRGIELASFHQYDTIVRLHGLGGPTQR